MQKNSLFNNIFMGKFSLFPGILFQKPGMRLQNSCGFEAVFLL